MEPTERERQLEAENATLRLLLRQLTEQIDQLAQLMARWRAEARRQ